MRMLADTSRENAVVIWLRDFDVAKHIVASAPPTRGERLHDRERYRTAS